MPSSTVLGTPDQLELEARAIAAWQSPQVRREVDALVEHYRADAQGSTAAGAATARTAADAIAFSAAQQAVLRDPDHPQLMWVANAPHTWAGLSVPSSGYGIENPDNIHRRVALDAACSYRLQVRRPAVPPAQQSFIVYAEEEGEGPVTREGTGIVGFLVSDRLDIADDGSFTITLDATPAEGRSNHIQLTEAATRLTVRDALSDWATQLPTALEIERTGGSAGRRSPELDDAAAAAETLARIGRYWVAWDNQMIYGAKPLNGLNQPAPRPFGASTAGHFALGEGESLLITVDTLGADYVGFEVTDPWGACREYRKRTGSLNNNQARHDAAGTLTYVLGPEDPGVWNWIDTDGLDSGMYALRWQGGSTADAAPVKRCDVVRTADVAGSVEEALLVTPADRAHQIRTRLGDYQRRLDA